MIRRFVLLILLCLIGVFDVESHEVQSVSVMEGDSVTLDCNVSEDQLKNEIEWRFNDIRIVKSFNGIPTYDEDVRFTNRLKLERSGSLTITDSRITDAGVYKFSTIKKDSARTFSVAVYDPVPIPVITSVISQCFSSSESPSSQRKFLLLCSAVNVSHVTLSWYKGNSLLSSISVSDLSTSLSLPLEVEYQDNNTYSCVLNNPLSHQTRHVCITDLCRLCSGDVSCCESTEAVIRLVVTALMGVAAVTAFIVLVYDIRSRSVDQERCQTLNDGSDTVKQE